MSSSGQKHVNVNSGSILRYGYQKLFVPRVISYKIASVSLNYSQSIFSSLSNTYGFSLIMFFKTSWFYKFLVEIINFSGTNKNASLCSISSITFTPDKPPSKTAGYYNFGIITP